MGAIKAPRQSPASLLKRELIDKGWRHGRYLTTRQFRPEQVPAVLQRFQRMCAETGLIAGVDLNPGSNHPQVEVWFDPRILAYTHTLQLCTVAPLDEDAAYVFLLRFARDERVRDVVSALEGLGTAAPEVIRLVEGMG